MSVNAGRSEWTATAITDALKSTPHPVPGGGSANPTGAGKAVIAATSAAQPINARIIAYPLTSTAPIVSRSRPVDIKSVQRNTEPFCRMARARLNQEFRNIVVDYSASYQLTI